MTARTSLRDYQRSLAERLRSADTGPVASKLGLQVADEAWLVDLSEAGEVLPVTPILSMPLTRGWFRGLTNVRGRLLSVVDFSAFLGRSPVAIDDRARLFVIGERYRLAAALLVDGSLGLRNPSQLEQRDAERAPWARAVYRDKEGRLWKELDVPELVQHSEFLNVGI